MRRFATLPMLFLSLGVPCVHAQFTLQDSTTTADLRGIASVGNGIAWASGSHGTVLRTEDGGFVWQGCATPPGAEQLDFRGIQAFDAQTALIMSSGKGPLSRVYKTTDGCRTWKLVFTNPDPEGFFDSILAERIGADNHVYVLGDSVAGKLVLWSGMDDDDFDWMRNREVVNDKALPGEGSFAASNSVLVRSGCSGHCQSERSAKPFSTPTAKGEQDWRHIWFASQIAGTSLVHRIAYEETPTCEPCRMGFTTAKTPLAQPSATSGIYSLAFRNEHHGVAVGGDYTAPKISHASAASTADAGATWRVATTPPHGYRSSVAYDAPSETWITVGPNGTDISRDDGRNWSTLRPAKDDAPDADQHWNALSLPFVVGPHGRIGRLRDGALTSRPQIKVAAPRPVQQHLTPIRSGL